MLCYIITFINPRSQALEWGVAKEDALKQRFRGLIMPLAALAAAAVTAPARAEVPTVAVSIRPLHSLVAGVMNGVGEPLLLLSQAASMHGYSLRPSELRAISRSRFVFWIGPSAETMLVKPLEAAAASAQIIAFSELEAVERLPLRKDDPVLPRPRRPVAGNSEAAIDSHLWLDPLNAVKIAHVVMEVLSAADPDNAGRYRRNAATLETRLTRLGEDISDLLRPVRAIPFVSFHDSLQYLERRYRLRALATVSTSPADVPGVRRLHQIRALISGQGVACVFGEAPHSPGLIRTIIAGSETRTEILDPLGLTVPPGPDHYFSTLRRLTRTLARCLSGAI